ncbi:MAG: hypothetical protein IKQ48_01670 [Paludibacteraceae bacterium]|nr:hypothetical protein [Paludibacteraceae bacterium]
MKKIYSVLVLAFVALATLSAAERDLWTGKWSVSWDKPDGDEHREWKQLGQSDFAAMEAGSTLYFYFEVEAEATYHKYNFDNYAWKALPGHEAEHDPDFSFGENTKVTFVLTQAVKDSIAAGGFAIHGHGFEVVKVSILEDDGQPAEGVIWSGNWYVSWELPDGDEHKEWKGIGQEDFASFKLNDTLCLLLEIVPTDEYHSYKLDDYGWNALPGQAQVDFSANTEVRLVITEAVKNAVATGGFALHGHGFNIVQARVAAYDTPSAVESVAIRNNGIRYNLLGQPVGEEYKGVVILNGKKMLQ